MKTQLVSRITLAAGALVVAMGALAVSAKADVWDKKTVLTVSQPTQVENTYLEPGTYVFKLMSSDSNRHVVQIFNRDQDHLINTVLAIPNYRLQPTGDTRFSFYETPAGTARAVHAWFYPGDNFGQEFRYPKRLRQIALAVTPQTSFAPAPEPSPEPMVTRSPEPEPEVSTTPQAETAPPAQEEPTVIAQNNPPPQPAPAAEPAKAEEPRELPKTASPFPLIGLGGLLALSAYTLLQAKRLS